MSGEEQERWILEVIDEGGYSFKELLEYVSRHGVGASALVKSLKSFSEQGLLAVKVLLDDESMTQLPTVAQERAIDNLPDIVAQESKSRSAHYLELTRKGTSVLAESGTAPE